MRNLKAGVKYYFTNDRGTPETYLILDNLSLGRYECEYFDKNGDYVREGSFNSKGTFATNLRENKEMKELKNFYIVWVEGSTKPPTIKYETLKEAKDCCKYLVDNKGVKKAYIMKKMGVAKVPSNIKFEMDKK